MQLLYGWRVGLSVTIGDLIHLQLTKFRGLNFPKMTKPYHIALYTKSMQSYYCGYLQSLKSWFSKLTPALTAINELIRAGWFTLLIVLSEAARDGLCVCITSHLLGHNVETEPLHYLALHGCPLSCICALASALWHRKEDVIQSAVECVVAMARVIHSWSGLYTVCI